MIYLGIVEQGLLQEITYSIKFTNGTAASSPGVTVYNQAGDNRTSIIMPSGSPSASTNIVTLPTAKDLDMNDETYRVVIMATVDGQLLTRVFSILPIDEMAL